MPVGIVSAHADDRLLRPDGIQKLRIGRGVGPVMPYDQQLRIRKRMGLDQMQFCPLRRIARVEEIIIADGNQADDAALDRKSVV